MLEINLGDIVRLKKKHPCGSNEWEVVRVGADIGIRCLGCQHRVLLDRRAFESRVAALVSRKGKAGPETTAERKKKLELKLDDLKKRWPPHSVPISMWQEREDLEEELEALEKETQN